MFLLTVKDFIITSKEVSRKREFLEIEFFPWRLGISPVFQTSRKLLVRITHSESGPNDHRKDASHYTFSGVTLNSVPLNIFIHLGYMYIHICAYISLR